MAQTACVRIWKIAVTGLLLLHLHWPTLFFNASSTSSTVITSSRVWGSSSCTGNSSVCSIDTLFLICMDTIQGGKVIHIPENTCAKSFVNSFAKKKKWHNSLDCSDQWSWCASGSFWTALLLSILWCFFLPNQWQLWPMSHFFDVYTFENNNYCYYPHSFFSLHCNKCDPKSILYLQSLLGIIHSYIIHLTTQHHM